MNWITRLFRKPAPQPAAPEPTGEGPLFGLSPPEGHQFHVTSRYRDWWHVRIVPEGDVRLMCSVAHECAQVERGQTNRDAIRGAAQRALDAYAESLANQEIEGFYPPKRAE